MSHASIVDRALSALCPERLFMADSDLKESLMAATCPGLSMPGVVHERVLFGPGQSIPRCPDRPQSHRCNPNSRRRISSTRGRRADRVTAHISDISSLGFRYVKSVNCQRFVQVCRPTAPGRQATARPPGCIKPRFALPSQGHRRPRCRDSELCFPASYARAGAVPLEDSSSGGRSAKLLCAA